jgi:hypothetical protein
MFEYESMIPSKLFEKDWSTNQTKNVLSRPPLDLSSYLEHNIGSMIIHNHPHKKMFN